VKVSEPAPVFVMLTLDGARLDVPACPAKLRLAGFTVSTGATGFTVRVADALLLVSARLVAVTITGVAEVTVGAVNKPDAPTVPAVADQLTAVFGVLPTLAVNCRVAPETAVAVEGDTEMLTAGAVASVLSIPIASTASESRERTRKWYVVPACKPPIN
jgi:hypothetical protein